jgi:glycosyltransferase involved in cell wall biosynthesis
VKALVVTCAHRGDDARIVHRQARSLLLAGHQVTLVGPLPDSVASDPDGLARVPIPRAVGRHRFRSWRACVSAVRARLHEHDLLLLHDPELLPVLALQVGKIPTVWDVHEDFVASVDDREWIPGPLRSAVASVVRITERTARRRLTVILAEDSYAERFPGAAVVPNSTWIPAHAAAFDPTVLPRVVHVGRLSRGRGVEELLETGRRLGSRAELVLIGDADPEVTSSVREAHVAGHVRWLGHLPNPAALEHVDGALAGLALLHDEANYRHSRPTKIIEYLARGVPVITTPLPLAVELVEPSGGGVIVEFGDVDACVAAIEGWMTHPAEREAAASAGRRFVAERYGWDGDAAKFVSILESLTAG